MRKIIKLRRIWLLLLYPVAAGLIFFASKYEFFAEWYADTIYPVISRIGNNLTGLAPFSVGEVLVYIFIIMVPAVFIRFFIHLVKKKENRGETTIKFCINLACFTGIVFFLFAVNCGTNYYRSTFAQTSGLEVKQSGETELVRLCKNLAADSDNFRTKVKTDSQSVMKLNSKNFSQNAQDARKAFDSLSKDYPLLWAGYSAPKPVISSKLMSFCNITGIFFPFTFEANVNTDVPDYTIPFTMCHELSHLRGFMREDEANFISYLACEKSVNPDFQYSGAVSAFTYASNALYSVDSSAANTVYAQLSAGVKKDLEYNSAYWDKFKGPAADAANSVNNSYLRANDQKDGVQSYGRMVDLLLALQRSKENKSAAK